MKKCIIKRNLLVVAFCVLLVGPTYAVIDSNAITPGPWTAHSGLAVWPNTPGTVDGDGTVNNGMQYYHTDWNNGDPDIRWDLNSPSAGLMETDSSVNGFRAFTWYNGYYAPFSPWVSGGPEKEDFGNAGTGLTVEFALRVKWPSNNTGGGHIQVAFSNNRNNMFSGDDPWSFLLDFRDSNPDPGGNWPTFQQIVDHRAVGGPVGYQTLTGDALHTYRAVFDPVQYDSGATRPPSIIGRLYKDSLQIGNVTMVTGSGDGDNRMDLGGWANGHASVIGAEWDYIAWRLGAYDPAPPPPTHNPGDVDDDNFVGGADLTQILTNWGNSTVLWGDGDIEPYPDGDGFVGGGDYTEVLTYWGTSYSPEAIPEPATLLLLLGGLGFLARRR